MEYLMHASSYFDVLFYALKYSMLKTHFFGLPFVKIFRQKPHFPQNPPPYTFLGFFCFADSSCVMQFSGSVLAGIGVGNEGVGSY